MIKTFIVEEDSKEERQDVFLTKVLQSYSRSQIKKFIKEKRLLNNNKPIEKKDDFKEGDIISLLLEDSCKEEHKLLGENIPINIVYEDEHILVVDKKAGMLVHPTEDVREGTLVNALLYHTNGILGEGEWFRPGIVHRIDKDTSGLLVVAKTNMAMDKLLEDFREHNLTRKYIALVHNNIREEVGIIDKPLGRDPKNRMRRTVVEGGRRAITEYRVLKRYGQYTLVEACLKTGRTHQIRAHFSYINHSLVGDSLYNNSVDMYVVLDGKKYPIQRQMLHAQVLGFNHPISRKYLEFYSKLPVDMEFLN